MRSNTLELRLGKRLKDEMSLYLQSHSKSCHKGNWKYPRGLPLNYARDISFKQAANFTLHVITGFSYPNENFVREGIGKKYQIEASQLLFKISLCYGGHRSARKQHRMKWHTESHREDVSEILSFEELNKCRFLYLNMFCMP